MLKPKTYITFVALLAAAGLGLSACTTTKEQDSSAVKAKLAASTGFTPQAWASSVDQAQLSQAQAIDWLPAFGDPLLSKLVAQAQQHNLNLTAAAAGVDRANALAVQAGAQLKPQANVSFANARSGSPVSSSTEVASQSLSLQLNWEVDLWGRISAGQRAAVASAEAAAADYKYSQHSLAASTAKAYFIAVEAGVQADILTEILTSLEETQRVVNVQYKNGIATAQDLALTKSDLAVTREQLITLEASKREALRALEVLLGQYPRGEIDVRKRLSALPPMPPPGVPSEVLERRPDLIAAERRVAAAFNSLKQAKAARLPQLSLTGNVSGSSNALSNITNPTNVVWQLASNLLVPILDGGARAAQVDVATAEQKQALAAYAQAALTAFNEVETNLDLANSLVARKHQLSVSQEEAEKAYRIAELRYKEGEISLVDLLAIQQRVLSARSNKVAVERLALEQRLNLYLALGGDWQSQ